MFFVQQDLLTAIQTMNIKAVKMLTAQANQKKINLNDYIKGNVTPLHWCILKCTYETQNEMIEILEILKNAGTDVNKCSNDKLKYSPLHTAARRALPEVVSWLIKNGANLHCQDTKLKKPIDYINSTIDSKKDNKDNDISRLQSVQQILLKNLQPLEIKSDNYANCIIL